jgi:N-acetylneuraminic acid mutarotase
MGGMMKTNATPAGVEHGHCATVAVVLVAILLGVAIELSLLRSQTASAQPRNQFSCVSISGRIYAIGGQFHHDSMQLDQPRVDIYDPETDSWSAGPPLPKGHSHAEAGSFVYGGRIYMVGGHTTPAGGKKSIDPDILALTPGSEWELVGKLPMPLSAPVAAIIGGKLYAGGGSPNGRSVQATLWVRSAP